MSLYDNMRKRKESGKKPRRAGSAGAPTDADFARAALTAKTPKKKPKKSKPKKKRAT